MTKASKVLDLRPTLIRRSDLTANVRALKPNEFDKEGNLFSAFMVIDLKPFCCRGKTKEQAMKRLIAGVNDYLKRKKINFRLNADSFKSDSSSKKG